MLEDLEDQHTQCNRSTSPLKLTLVGLSLA